MNGGGMEVRITSRHTTLPESLRSRTEELLSKLKKYDDRVSVVEVIFDEEKNSKKIEGILHIDRSEPIVATGEGDEFSEALSQMNERLVRQLRKLHEQAKDHRAPPLTEALSQE
jgi:ribosomal subunit interface protein